MADTPVVCVLGPRQVGKSTLVQQLDPGRHYVTFDDPSILEAAQEDPLGFVRALPEEVTLDEVQRVPELLPSIKLVVDENRAPGRFILTGSANLLLLPQVQESLAGRMEIVHLHPVSEMEKQGARHSLLRSLLKGELKSAVAGSGQVVEGVAEAICMGGYPEPNKRTRSAAKRWYGSYLKAIVQRDIKDLFQIQKEGELLRLIELLAYRTASLVNVSKLSIDSGIDRETCVRYLAILERLFLARLLPAWHRNQAKRLIKTPKIHMVDSGLAAYLNNLSVAEWASHGTEFGGLLESFVVQQLICQAGWVNPNLRFSHYRDKEKVEVDLVIELGRSVWGVEVKRSATFRNRDGAGLARLASQAGKQFKGGMLLYSGTNCLPLQTDGCFAVPLDHLWIDA